MFDQKCTCPMGKDIKKEGSCEGCRKDGILKNMCASRCARYKKYVKEKI